MADQRKDRLLGRVLDGRFRLDDLLGSGGMGKVYAGMQLSVDRRVAVKVLREELSESETLTQRFFREAKVVASLRHSNVVGLVDFGRDEELNLLYIAMEYVDGVSLARLLRRGRLEAPLAVGIARQICSALAEAHAAGVIHRDLKPDNVMVVTTAEGALSVKVLDFGIALPTGEEARLTSTGAVVGTPHYMAPEQAQDRPITAQSDIYSLGVLIYEMLTGRLPFVAETPMAVLLKVITQPPPPLDEVLGPEQLPPDALIQLMTAMLSKEPERRPEDIVAVATHLDELSRTHQFVTPTVSTESDLDALVIARASDEFVFAPTAASPVPTPSSVAAIPPVSTANVTAEKVSARVPSVQLDPPKPKKRWAWFIIPLVFMGCCCLPVVNSWLDHATKKAAGADIVDAGVSTTTDSGTNSGTNSSSAAVSATIGVDLGPDVEPTTTGVIPPVPVVPPVIPKVDGKKPPTPAAPSKVEADGSVLGGSRGGTCNGDKECDWTGGTVGCNDQSQCRAKCPDGNCTQLATGQANAEFHCEGGNCVQQCLDQASCDMKCSGGGCTQRCGPDAGCNRECSEGCTQ